MENPPIKHQPRDRPWSKLKERLTLDIGETACFNVDLKMSEPIDMYTDRSRTSLINSPFPPSPTCMRSVVPSFYLTFPDETVG